MLPFAFSAFFRSSFISRLWGRFIDPVLSFSRPFGCERNGKFLDDVEFSASKFSYVSIFFFSHSSFRDFTAELLSEVCNDVAVVPMLTPCTGEKLQYKTANKAVDARMDVSDKGEQ